MQYYSIDGISEFILEHFSISESQDTNFRCYFFAYWRKYLQLHPLSGLIPLIGVRPVLQLQLLVASALSIHWVFMPHGVTVHGTVQLHILTTLSNSLLLAVCKKTNAGQKNQTRLNPHI